MELIDTLPLRYLLTVPDDGGREPRPVLCFLHGYDEGAPTPIHAALTRHGPLHPDAAARLSAGFVVVAPQLPTRGDIWFRYATDVLALLRDVQGRHGGDPQRTHLTGFSFGGNGVFDLALAEPGFWAGLWAVDPTRVPSVDAGVPIWLSLGEISRRLRARFVEALALQPANATPAGERVWADEGLDHVGAARHAYADPQIYDWLLRQPGPPR